MYAGVPRSDPVCVSVPMAASVPALRRVRIADVSLRRPSLDEVFLKLTHQTQTQTQTEVIVR